jgi:hypothetical protein
MNGPRIVLTPAAVAAATAASRSGRTIVDSAAAEPNIVKQSRRVKPVFMGVAPLSCTIYLSA